MYQNRRFALTSLVVIAALVLTACGSSTKKEAPSPTEAPKQQEAPKPAVKQAATGGELVYRVPEDPDSFAPFWAASAYSATVTDKVFGDGLIGINYHTLQPEPRLAEALPTVSADKLTYTFKVRKGVKFHDGTEVTAQDIVFPYEILMSDDYKGRWKSIVADLASIRVVDDYTVEMTTKQVLAPFMFSVPTVYPIPKAKFQGVAVKDMANNDFWKKPIGAGPWKFVEWKPGQYTLLARNDDYWAKGRESDPLVLEKGKKGVEGPWFDTIRIRVIQETNTAVAALEAGELGLFGNMEPSFVDRLKEERKNQLYGFDWDRMGFGYQTFNMEAYPTNILEVRQALSHALNREAILKGVMENKATIPAGFVPPIHWVFNKDLKTYNYDQKKAVELIEKAGFRKNAKGVYEKDGKPLKIVYVGTKGSTLIEGIALQSQKDWQAIGAEVEIQLVDFNTLLKGFKTGEFNVSFSGLGFSVDPHSSFYGRFHSSQIGRDAQGLVQGSNTARFSNSKVDELIDKGKVTLDLNERKKIYQEAEALIMAEAPVLPIYVNQYTDFVKKEYKGLSVANGYGLVNLQQWYVNEK